MSGKKMTADEMKTMLAELKQIDAELATAAEAMQSARGDDAILNAIEARTDELVRKRARAMGLAEEEIARIDRDVEEAGVTDEMKRWLSNAESSLLPPNDRL
jgi:hypothetical protein